MDPSTRSDPARDSTSRRPRWQGSLRATIEALPLVERFRATAALAVVAAILVFQLAGALWDARQIRAQALQVAESRAAAMAARLEQAGGGGLDDLAAHPWLLTAAFSLEGGEVVDRYVRGGRPGPGLPEWTRRPAGGSYALRSWLALAPMYVGHEVSLGPKLSGTVSIVVDHRPAWRAAGARLAQTPLAIALALLAVWLVTGVLRRQLDERIAPLADDVAADVARRSRNGHIDFDSGVVAIAERFAAMRDQMARYERDLVETRHAAGRRIIERTQEVEDKLRKSEAVMRAKDEFLANMSHEIRTPMNGVLGMAELLAGTELDKRQRRFVDSMRAAAETMMQIINDILDDSKIAAGKMDLASEPVDVRELVEQAAQLYAGRAERKNLEMICRIEPTVPSVVSGDLLRLRQVLGNLLSNAVKYTESGEVELRVGLDDLRDGQCRLHFSVRDTGPGIAESDQSGVFQAFTQLGGSARLGGTGLGLSIATRLVKLMGGERIDLRSELGRGSTFSFVVPFQVREPAPVPDAASDEFSGLRVLVVDDNSTSLLLLDEMMANWSAEVTALNRAQMAIQRMREAAAKNRPFDAVLVDYSLPDATTEQLLRAIRLDPALASSYVVLLSALAFDPAYEGGRAIAPDATIGKPVREPLLRGVLAASRQARSATPAAAPAAVAVPASAPEPEVRQTAAYGLRVLVADDNAINREVAVAMLETLGCSAVLALDGQAAVAEARRGDVDLILMDCQMPVLDGYDATAAIRADEQRLGRAATPIVALTANVMARDRERCLAAGMNGFLAKPFSAAQLADLLQATASQRVASRAALPESPDAGRDGAGQAQAAAAAETPALGEAAVATLLETPASGPESAVRLMVLDPEQVLSIRGLGKPQLFERLCEALFAAAGDAFARIDAALAAGDLEALAEAAHALKSPVANLGGRRLADLLERCETLAREGGDPTALRRVATALKPHYAALMAALQAETRRAAAG